MNSFTHWGMALVAIVLAVAIHITAMAVCAICMGIRVRSVSFGIGPTLLRLGPVHLRLLPVAGHVLPKDSRAESDGDGNEDGDDGDVMDPADFHDAFNHQPMWKQVLLRWPAQQRWSPRARAFSGPRDGLPSSAALRRWYWVRVWSLAGLHGLCS